MVNSVVEGSLWTGLRQALAKQIGAGGSTRAAAVDLGRRLALALDRHWSRAKDAREGPIDVLDFFSGCGGMSAGFHAVNAVLPAYKLVLAVDIDGIANATYGVNLGLNPVAEDVSEISRSRAKLHRLIEASGRRASHPLVMIGCAPCQGFSSHRNSAGRKDSRNSLFVDFARIAAALRPDAIIVENVPELLTTAYWPYVVEARRLLRRAGYRVHVGIHNMAHFGVPQERFRAVILAMPNEFSRPPRLLERPSFRTVRQAIGGLPPLSAGQRDKLDAMHYTVGHRQSTLETIRAIPKDGGSRPPGVGPKCLQRIHDRQGKEGYEDIYGRLAWDRPAITVTAYSRNPASGRFVHPEQDRGLSVREAALLQGFPSDYWFAGSLDQSFRQIGNAVPPIFSSFLAAYLLGELVGGPPHEAAGDCGIEAPVGPSFSRLIPALKAGHLPERVS